MKHTLGPWKLHDMEENVIVGKDHLTIADVNATNRSKEENNANALLIASAPELLEACKVGLKEMELWATLDECDCPPEGHICGLPRLKINIVKAKQAIAKAEGGK